MRPEPARIQRWGHGDVCINGRMIAQRPNLWNYSLERVVERVRDRTSDEWWLRAFEVHDAGMAPNTGGPLGLGVDFFADDYELLLDDDARAAIENDAYEAARGAILDGLAEHMRLMESAVAALALFAKETPS